MKKINKLILTGILLSATLVTYGCSGQTADKSQTSQTSTAQAITSTKTETKEETANKLPTFESVDIDGNKISSDIFKQKDYTLINFWGTYCPPCIQEMPELGKISDDYEDKNLQVVGIVIDTLSQNGYDKDQIAKAKKIIKKTGAQYTHIQLDTSMSELLTQLDLNAVPRTLLVDKELNILEDIEGSRDLKFFEKMIEDAQSKAE